MSELQTNEVLEQEAVSEKKVTLRKKDLLKSFFIWETTSEMCLSYERLMSLGFCHCMVPILKRLYPNDKDKLADGLTRHRAFFNTENNWGALIPGIVASMEEDKANGADYSDDTINSVKVGLMGPLAGIGDTITQGLVRTLLLAIFIALGMEGHAWAPLVFFLIYTAYILGIGYFMFSSGYKLGRKAFGAINDTAIIRRLTDCMSVLGLTVAGAMVASYVGISTSAVFTAGESTVVLQEVLDGIMPQLLSVGTVFGIYGLLKKNVSVIKIMLILVVVGLVGSFIGFF